MKNPRHHAGVHTTQYHLAGSQYTLRSLCKVLSQNVALIEIKTPCTDIIGSQYRGTYSLSHELTGAVNQVLNYRDKLTKAYYSLCQRGDSSFEVFSPKCVVVIGKISSLTSDQTAAFENFRSTLNNVTIITFDELQRKIIDLISVLSETDSETDVETINEPQEIPASDGELPF